MARWNIRARRRKKDGSFKEEVGRDLKLGGCERDCEMKSGDSQWGEGVKGERR